MKWVKRAALAVGALVVLVVLVAAGGWVWATGARDAVLAKTWEAHTIDFPVPFPLTEAEIAQLREEKRAQMIADAMANPVPSGPAAGPPVDAGWPPGGVDPLEGVDLGAVALERARARGKHYTEARFVCFVCHGADFSGGTMIDDPAIGKLLGPNVTRGGKTKDYTVADWDRAVRHGVLPGGHTSMMPVGDFQEMSDRELSDVIAYIDSLPSKPGSETVREWGPMGTVLVATGTLVPDVYKVAGNHQAKHPTEPPVEANSVEFGRHLTRVCIGCHRNDLEGGPMPFGPPDWPPAANLTPHADGLAGWTYDDFKTAMRRGKSKDGANLRMPMSEMLPVMANVTDLEMTAMWTFIEQAPAKPTGQ